MNLDELQSIQSKERQTDSLQPLRASFYEEVAEYIQSLREERERVADEQGFDAPEFRRLSDEIDAAEDTVESLYERRVGKVVKAASFAAAGMPAEDEGLTAEEQDLFDTLVGDIKANRERVLDVLAGESEATGDAVDTSTDDADAGAPTDDERPVPDPTPESSEGVDAADLMGGEDESIGEPAPDQSEGATPATPTAPDARPSDDSRDTEGGDGDTDGPDAARADSSRDPPAPEPDDSPPDDPPEPSTDGGAAAATETVDRTTVRITRDVGEILGVDERAYDLGEDDVVTLPSANAAPLVERDAAERLE